MNEENNGGFVTGFFAGAALGAMAAILLTPRSGRELRDELAAGGERLRDRAYDSASSAREQGDRMLERTRATVQEAAEGLREAAEALRARTEKLTER